ncbi:MAG: hypothetical protein ACRDTD_01920 [Pseudonocardiaceae bacterium]
MINTGCPELTSSQLSHVDQNYLPADAGPSPKYYGSPLRDPARDDDLDEAD